MRKNCFVIVLTFCLLCAGGSVRSESDDGEWIPVPLEEIERVTLRRPAPETQPTEPEILPETRDVPAGQEASRKPDADTQPDTKPAEPKQTNRLTPEEIARRIRSKGPPPVVYPQQRNTRKRGVSRTAAEGQAVIGRIGRVKKIFHSDDYLVTFENNRHLPYQSPQRLLPCRLLEEVEAHLKDHPDARFRFSGECTRDTKHAYLLLDRVAVLEENVSDIEPSDAPDDSPTSQPTSQPAADTTGSLITQMLRDRPGRAVRIAPSPKRKAEENVESVAPAGRTPFSPGKRDLVVDRIIRVIREPDSQWWQARFESDNTLREPPLRILPGLRLEWIKQMMADSGKSDMLLRVSGDVTYYKGKRYLMLRKVLRQRDLDQF
ncbi:MAG: hypothetical protein JXA11_14880 [Phycisphaerae bacterium]|nr:hypothetical protein [Phycisphaerae bacterium]